MLTIHANGETHPVVWLHGNPVPDNAAWLDLCEPDATEVKACEEVAKLKLPDCKDIVGIGLAGATAAANNPCSCRFRDSPTWMTAFPPRRCQWC